MKKDDNKHLYKDRMYRITFYDPHWHDQFEQYASMLQRIFIDARIEHIGSTSVPGMCGKFSIDVLVIVNDLKTAEEHRDEMVHAGFDYAGQFVMDDSRLFRMMRDNILLANIHFFPVGHPHIEEMLGLKNYLRSNPDEVTAYSRLKNELYAKYPNDYASYRRYKDVYMNELIKRAS